MEALQLAIKSKRTHPPTAHYDAATAQNAVLLPNHPYRVGTSDTKNSRSHSIPARLGDLWATQRHLAAGFREGRVDPEGDTEPGCQVFLLAQSHPHSHRLSVDFKGPKNTLV